MILQFKLTNIKSKASQKIEKLLDNQRRIVVPSEEAQGYRWKKRKYGTVRGKKSA